LTKANRAVSLGVVSLVVIAIILIVGFGVYLNTTFNTTSTSFTSSGQSTSSSSREPTTSYSTSQETGNSAPCLIDVQNATITNFQNSSYIGYKVSLPNGTTSYFPLGGCPSPVSPKLCGRFCNRRKFELHCSREELHVCR